MLKKTNSETNSMNFKRKIIATETQNNCISINKECINGYILIQICDIHFNIHTWTN